MCVQKKKKNKRRKKCLNTRIGWKVHKLTKVLSGNVIKWDLFFKSLPYSQYTSLSVAVVGSH